MREHHITGVTRERDSGERRRETPRESSSGRGREIWEEGGEEGRERESERGERSRERETTQRERRVRGREDTTRDAVMDMRRELRSRGEAGIDLVRAIVTTMGASKPSSGNG